MTLIYYGLQPLIMILALGYWMTDPASGAIYPMTLFCVHILLGVVEHYWPKRPDWVIHAKQKLLNIFLVLLLTSASVAVAGMYDELLREPLNQWRASVGMDIWPHTWPLLVQVFMVFFASEFIWYWMHRAEHRWAPVWRLSGHGAHHSFKKLNALNFGLNHPLELFFIVLPSALVELVFGVGLAAAGAGLLAVLLASIAHCNIHLNSRWIGLLFTTNKYHIHHHSAVLEESNTNFGCSAIVWDRLFGTFADAETEQTGTGPTEPTLWQKFVMPVKEPDDTAVAP